ncbi:MULTISPECIES: hypothetical protein [unclassified Methanoregula]|uniref:hypothetical protein n=1 Tax=unclassified Methanoregula TaxID=2649730 RepID=UPI0009C5FFE0|nr:MULTISPECIES: hypothetical protein [unclassified Methanoregula]OPX62263.1 MAG: hypothetical protein A4E33_02332 [Methanoregula sp. PtaB.Bin085]OPY32690.1 MAG: hypothetical protein A4E34_02066 [Methanoregula sp. PtaU1.Bin006]
MNLPAVAPARRNILILLPLITVICVGLFGRLATGSFADLFDFQIYYTAVENVLGGRMPWAGGVEFYYPPLAFVPLLIAYAASLFGGGPFVYVLVLWVEMICCSVITTFCVYLTGLKIYPEKTAFLAAVLNATALSVAYYSLCRFDAFPACLAMLAITAALYDDRTTGYIASLLGLFTKIWPIVVFPFLWIYNARKTSVIEEGKQRAFAFLAGGGLLFGLMILAGYDKFLGYAGRVYCNTVPYAVHQYLLVAGIVVPFDTIAILFRLLTVVIVLGALYLMYRQPGNIVLMLKLVLAVIIAIILFSQYRSPQYIVWFTPLAALLVAGDLKGILVFVAIQVMGYIEYPFGYNLFWVNDRYVSGWGMVFFTVFFLMIGLLLWRAFLVPDVKEKETVRKEKGRRTSAKK